MKTLYLDTSPKIPEESPVTTLEKNAWIAPNGDFYGLAKSDVHKLNITNQ